MGNKLSYMQKICGQAAAQCHAAWPALTLHFLLHDPGGLQDAIELAEGRVKRHKAADGARTILAKSPMTERSSLLGIAMKSGKILGLFPRNHFLALINVNSDDIEDSHQARRL